MDQKRRYKWLPSFTQSHTPAVTCLVGSVAGIIARTGPFTMHTAGNVASC
jgi:hypothetical protein